jgi:NADH-quinone oxidoreductase subunit C
MSEVALGQLKEKFPEAILLTHSLRGDDTAIVDAARLLEVARFLRDDPQLRFDQLIDLTALDTLGLNDKTSRAIGGTIGSQASQTVGEIVGVTGAPAIPQPVAGRFQVVYHLRSSKTGKRLRLKSPVDEGPNGENPEIDSVSSLWKSAQWAERETWDMFGVRFRGHPDLRRILMYEEFVGHPLRKDYPKEKRQPLVRRDFT